MHLPGLSNDEISALMQPLSKDEVKQAPFSLPNDKSSRLDGFNTEFFKTYWTTVGECVTAEAQRFFRTGHFFEGMESHVTCSHSKSQPTH